jgi:hypothetical protein
VKVLFSEHYFKCIFCAKIMFTFIIYFYDDIIKL